VRLLRLRIRGFKRLHDLDLDLDHDRILVSGSNETGKSTLVEAILAGLYGLAPQKRGAGHGPAVRQVLPWDGRPAGVCLTLRLDSGHEVECDWDFSGEKTTILDRTAGEDITARFEAGSHGWVDSGAGLLRLPASVFGQLTCVGEGQLATLGDDVEIREGLLRLADSGVDALAEQALARLLDGARQATVPRVTAATRRNALGRELGAVEAAMEAAVQARQELEREVAAIESTSGELEAASARLTQLTGDRSHRAAERDRLRREADRAQGRLAEAELRLEALVHQAPEQLRPWTDAELDTGRALLAEPLQVRRPAASWPGIVIALGGALLLTLGLVDREVILVGAALVVIAVGVFALTQSRGLQPPPLRVGERSYPDRRALMTAVDQERARREYEIQKDAVADLRRRLEGLQQSGDEDLSDAELEEAYAAAARRHGELNIQLERQRAALERGASQVPEVAPLEERAADLRRRIARLEEFGQACTLAASALETASVEIRRSYAPRLQAYLGEAISRVTAGRYEEALVTDSFDVMLRAPESGSMVDMRRLSRGTQQQVYLLLRLALLDTMGEGSERLPVLLDDALALADDPRRAELLRVLDGEARQVIYLTALEGEAEALFGPEWHRLRLAPPLVEAAPAGQASAPASDDEDAGARETVVAGGVEPGPGGGAAPGQ